MSFITDASGVAQKILRWFYNDAGTPRNIEQAWYTDNSGVPRQVFLYKGLLLAPSYTYSYRYEAVSGNPGYVSLLQLVFVPNATLETASSQLFYYGDPAIYIVTPRPDWNIDNIPVTRGYYFTITDVVLTSNNSNADFSLDPGASGSLSQFVRISVYVGSPNLSPQVYTGALTCKFSVYSDSTYSLLLASTDITLNINLTNN